VGSMISMEAIGNVGKDPELKYLPSGTALCKFSIAVNIGKGEQRETTWISVATFGKAAETHNQYVRKGSLVFVRGTVTPSPYIDKQGNAKCSLELSASDVVYLGKSEDSGYGGDDGGDDDVYYGNIPF